MMDRASVGLVQGSVARLVRGSFVRGSFVRGSRCWFCVGSRGRLRVGSRGGLRARVKPNGLSEGPVRVLRCGAGDAGPSGFFTALSVYIQVGLAATTGQVAHRIASKEGMVQAQCMPKLLQGRSAHSFCDTVHLSCEDEDDSVPIDSSVECCDAGNARLEAKEPRPATHRSHDVVATGRPLQYHLDAKGGQLLLHTARELLPRGRALVEAGDVEGV